MKMKHTFIAFIYEIKNVLLFQLTFGLGKNVPIS